MRAAIEHFLEVELESETYGDKTNYKVNVYLTIFKMVFEDNFDVLECIPGMVFTWSTPWGNLVTVRLTTYPRQYRSLMNIIYQTGTLL